MAALKQARKVEPMYKDIVPFNAHVVPLGCVTLDSHLVPLTAALTTTGTPLTTEAAEEIRSVVGAPHAPPGHDAVDEHGAPGGTADRAAAHARVLEKRRAMGLSARWQDDVGVASGSWRSELLRAVLRNREPDTEAVLASGCGEGDDRTASPEVQAARANVRNWQTRPALSLACCCGFIEVARVLLDAGADPDAADEQGFTALHESCHEGFTPLVELLLARGADPAGGRGWRTPRRPREPEQLCMSPLGIACKRGAFLAARALLRRDPTQACVLDIEGLPPFFTAALYKHVACAEAVLDLGRMEMAPAPGEAPGNGALVPLPLGAALGCAHRGAQLLTPAHNAAYNNALEVLRFLVARGAPLEACTATGKTPLMLAAGEAHGEAVAVLVEAGVAIDTAQQAGANGDADGATAFHHACTGGTPAHADVAAYLVSKGAKGVCNDPKCMKCKLLVKQARRRLARQAESAARAEAVRRQEDTEQKAAEVRAVEAEVEASCPSLFCSFADFANELRATERNAEEELQARRQAEADEKAERKAAAAAGAAAGETKGGGKAKKKGKKGKKGKKK